MASVRIALDQPRHHVYTNLDNLCGKVILTLESQDTISEIVVKLEGVLKTQLPVPTENNQKERQEVDEHKVLYQTQTVFPIEAVRLQQKASNSSYTLNSGVYEYPFQFKIPIHNNCLPVTGWLQKLNRTQRSIEYQPRRDHRRSILPPSLTCVSGHEEAKIRYYVKVTVKRASILKLNPREESTFVFCPIEPPRPPHTGQEVFAKREHQFIQGQKKKNRGLFQSLRSQSNEPTTRSRFSIEARLPAAAIISHSSPIPLRIILKKLEEFPHPIIIRGLQLRLLSKTHIECFDLQRDIFGNVEFFSNFDLRVPVGSEASAPDRELEVDSAVWRDCRLPTSVAPTFTSCNISRAYLLELIIGVSVGEMPHYDTIPLQIPVTVYSGIEPPKELKATNEPTITNPGKGKIVSEQAPSKADSIAPSKPNVVGEPSSSSSAAVPDPATNQAPPPSTAEFDALHETAPPTYDEATISDLPSVEGPRREFPQGPDYFRREKA